MSKEATVKNSTQRKRSKFRGRSTAFKNFSLNLIKTKLLLNVGLSGISTKVNEIEEVIGKLGDTKIARGRVPKNYEPSFEAKKTDKDNFELTMDVRTAALLRRALEFGRAEHTALRFHLYSILAVAIWGAYETYLITLLEELYRKRPEILKSQEMVTYKEVVDRSGDPLEMIIEKQIEKVGHFTHKEMLKYLSDKINFNFTASKQKTLSDYYLIRNIIAHNSGIVQSNVHSHLPSSLLIKNKQIRITKTFLRGMLKAMESSVQDIEKHISKKFFA